MGSTQSLRRATAAVFTAAALTAVVIATTFATASPVGAQTGDECPAVGGFTVNYLNGMSNTWTQAFESRVALAEALGDTHDGQPVTYNNLYNNTHGQIADAVEVFDQKVREAVETGVLTEESISTLVSRIVGTGVTVGADSTSGVAWLLAQVPIDVVRDAGGGLGELLAVLPGWYDEAFGSLNTWMAAEVRRFADEALLDAETRHTIDEHAAQLRSQIASGRKPLVVAHSQGNLFANPVATKVRADTADDALGVAHVATPAMHLSGPYVTINTDLVIAPFFTTAQAPPPNVWMAPFIAGSNHGFVDAYLLEGEQARGALLDMARTEMDRIVSPAGAESVCPAELEGTAAVG